MISCLCREVNIYRIDNVGLVFSNIPHGKGEGSMIEPETMTVLEFFLAGMIGAVISGGISARGGCKPD
jgi:hypothetical protein